jgi:hypothetical protein
MIAAVRNLWSKRMDHHAPPIDPDAEWLRVLAAVESRNPAPDVELEVMARGDVLAAPLTDPIEAFEADLDLLAFPICTGTLVGRTEAA